MFKKLISFFKRNKNKNNDQTFELNHKNNKCISHLQTMNWIIEHLNNIEINHIPPKTSSIGSDKNVIIVDDVSDTYVLYNYVIESLKLNEKGYNFVYYLGKDSGIRFLKDIRDNKFNNDNITLLILDITLGDIYHLDNILILDGVDVAAVAQLHIDKDKIYFLTSHTKNCNNPIMKEYKEKYECLIDNNFESKLYNKVFEREILLEKCLLNNEE